MYPPGTGCSTRPLGSTAKLPLGNAGAPVCGSRTGLGGSITSMRATPSGGGGRCERRGAHRYPSRFGGYFSPASIFALRMFCFGGSGHVVYSLNAHGGL